LGAMCERLPPKDRFPPKTRPLEQDRSSGGDEMRHPQERSQQMIGMASSGAMTNGRDLDRNRRTEALLLLMLKVDVALRSKILLGRGTIALFL
jgi:hypothetical protein